MGKNNIIIIMFYNFFWLWMSFQWFDNFMRKVRTPIFYHLLFYILIYLFFTICFIYLLKYIKRPLILAVVGSGFSIIIATLALTLTELVIEIPDFTNFTRNYEQYGLFWMIKKNVWMSSVVTLAFLAGPASLLSCYFTNIVIQKINNKNN